VATLILSELGTRAEGIRAVVTDQCRRRKLASDQAQRCVTLAAALHLNGDSPAQAIRKARSLAKMIERENTFELLDRAFNKANQGEPL
jgi:hypothetical protein